MLKLLNKFANWMYKRGSVSALYLDNKLYLERFYIFRLRWKEVDRFAIVLHRFWIADPYLHCHPWDNISIILTGWYKEERFDGTIRTYFPRSFAYRQAEVFHRIAEISEFGKVWSLFISFKRKRIWGKITEGKWKPVYRRMDEGFVGNVFPKRKT